MTIKEQAPSVGLANRLYNIVDQGSIASYEHSMAALQRATRTVVLTPCTHTIRKAFLDAPAVAATLTGSLDITLAENETGFRPGAREFHNLALDAQFGFEEVQQEVKDSFGVSVASHNGIVEMGYPTASGEVRLAIREVRTEKQLPFGLDREYQHALIGAALALTPELAERAQEGLIVCGEYGNFFVARPDHGVLTLKSAGHVNIMTAGHIQAITEGPLVGIFVKSAPFDPQKSAAVMAKYPDLI